MKPRSVLVTGGAGFIGRWVVRELLSGGSGPVNFEPPRVLALDNLENGHPDNVAEFSDDPNFVGLVVGDVIDRTLIGALFDEHEFDLVLHLAAKINVQESIDDPTGVFESDVVGTFYLLEAARLRGSAFAFMSTCMVYARSTDPAGITESHRTLCASPYAGAKLAAENLVESYHRAYGMPTITLRPFNTYGPWQKATGEGGVVSIFLRQDEAMGELKIYGDGTQTRDLLYVEDCAAFCVSAALCDDAIGRVVNAGTGVDVTVNDLANSICADPSRIRHVPHIHPQSEIAKLQANVQLADRLIGWRPTVALADGIARTRTWIRKEMNENP